MENILFSPAAPILAVILAIIFWIIRDQISRKEKWLLTQEIKNSKAKVVDLDTKLIQRASSFTSFSMQWENIEVIFTEKSVLCFSYWSLFGYRLYMFIKHWYLPGAKVPRKLTQSTVIEELKINGQDLVITSSLGFSKVTATIKNVVGSGQFEIIKKLLDLSYADYQES